MSGEKRLRAIVARALDGVAGLAETPGSAGADLTVQPREGEAVSLYLRWVGEGWPEDVRRSAAALRTPWPPNLVFLARRFSPGALDWLRENGGNWADEAGQVRIVGPEGMIVIREPRLATATPRADFRWSPSATAVAETILSRPGAPLRIRELAALSEWSAPQVATVLKGFDAKGWTNKQGPARGRGAHRRLIDADGLLTAFAAAVGDERREVRLAHRATPDLMGLLRDSLVPVLEQGVGWALSGWAGLELTVPFTTVVPGLHVYVEEEDFAGSLSTAIDAAGLREVEEGARVTFWRADPRIVARASRHGGLPVVSPPRLYGDLSSFGARGQDAADHVKRELIDPPR